MIGFTITDNKGKRTRVVCPNSWEEVTLKQLLEIEECNMEPISLFSILSGVQFTILEESKDTDLEYMLYEAVAFIHKTPVWDKLKPPSKIEAAGKVITVPKDISVLTLGQKIMFDQLLLASKSLIEVIPKVLAIYFQPLFDDSKYDRERLADTEKIIVELPAIQMYSIANFFLNSRETLKKFGMIGLHLIATKNSQFKNLQEQINSTSSGISQ